MVLLATGVSNRRPEVDTGLHNDALARDLLRCFPICDGCEVADKRIGVIGTGDHELGEATFLRAYTDDITLISPAGANRLTVGGHARADAYGLTLIDGLGGVPSVEGRG